YYAIAAALRPDSPGTRYNHGLALVRIKALDEAAAEFQAAIGLQPEYAEARSELGMVWFKRGELDRGVEAIQTAIRHKPHPAHPPPRLGRGPPGRVGQGHEGLCRAHRHGPENPETNHNLGKVLAKKGLVDQAMPLFEKAIRLQPDGAGARMHLGVVLLRKGRL